MLITLYKFLIKSGYFAAKLQYLKTKHYSLELKINGIIGTFILDTGASNSCICASLENKFNVISKETIEKASSATSEIINAKVSRNNTIQIGKWKIKINLISFNMNHINQVLGEKKIDSIEGILGADILKKSKAILDYKSSKLYLKS